MGKITDALKKAAEERVGRFEKMSRQRERKQVVFKRIEGSKLNPALVTFFDSKAVISEQYKTLRTNLLSLNKKKSFRKIGITSSQHSEGKTVTSLNLAISLAQDVKKPRILLIDADMRRGRIHSYLGVKPEVGLSDILGKSVSPDDAYFQIDIENLTFVSSGKVPENPAELLDSDQMTQFLNYVGKDFDFVIIDTPPIIPVTDAGIIGSQVDGLLMVVEAGRTQRGMIQRSEELLQQAQCNILGHVLTNIEYHLPEYLYRYL